MKTSSSYIAVPKVKDGHVEIIFGADLPGQHAATTADRVHLLEAREIRAINAAIAAGRPLLVQGEPGVGKSQLARAAAKTLGRAYVKHVVDSHTESRDLMWYFDAVKRLADAQLAGALRKSRNVDGTALDVSNYLHPGPLWWVFDPATAQRQSAKVGVQPPSQPDGGKWERGCVFLLDEIDKAEAEVPNGLLDALGAREFTPFGMSQPVGLTGVPPLVVITTNEERTLPDAFRRRCFVLSLALPKDDDALVQRLIERGLAHFPGTDAAVLRKAAELLLVERKKAAAAHITARPGQAEYLDLLRAVLGLAEGDVDCQMSMIDDVSDFTLRKHTMDDSNTR